MGKETGLPKNIRQIGDIQGKEKIFLEDYVMTYIRKKEKQEMNGYLGIFLGEKQERDGNTYVFIRGILDMPKESAAEPDKERREEQKEDFVDKETFQDKGWKEDSRDKGRKEEMKENDQEQESRQPGWMEKMEREYKEYFSQWSVQGCCVIGLYSPERMQMLSEMLPEAGSLIYHLQEQEETIYRVENGRYRQIKGYFVFYEQNRKMQEYMADVFDKDCVEKEGGSDNAIKSFRKKVKEKGIQKNTSLLKLASSFFVITVLVIGAVVVNKVEDLRLVREEARIADTTRENEITRIQTESPVLTVTDEITESMAVSETASAQSMPVSGTASDQSMAVSETASDQSMAVSEMADTQNEAVSGITDVGNTDVSGTETDTGLWNEYSLSGSDSFWEEVPEDAAETELQVQEAASVRQTQAAYVIKEGDTLADICSRYYGNLNYLEEICEINEITDANKIMPGQKIVLP